MTTNNAETDRDQEDWHGRWRDGRIGFHQPVVNRLLEKFWPTLVAEPHGSVFIPLCGKSHDMTWLAERGHDVIGVELSEIAASAYFSERGLDPAERQSDGFKVLSGGGVEIWCGDYFAFPKSRISDCVGAYDRASLIALPPAVRKRYADTFTQLMPPATETLLLTISYDQSEADGPPFSVPDGEVHALFADNFAVRHLGSRDATEASGNLTSKGVTSVSSSVFALHATPSASIDA
ncbi:MAG: thiopurine S-methyltransferase [Pseudomonadota bacterium]